MLRKNLLLTTAFVVATALSSAAADARPKTAALGRDSNNEFLQNYSCGQGQFTVSASSGELSSNHLSSAWQRVAIPVVGRGTAVESIVVRNAVANRFVDNQFSVGIYSATASGLPGDLIAGGPASASSHCRTITVSNSKNKSTAQDKILDRGGHDVAAFLERQLGILGIGPAYQTQSVCADPHLEPRVFHFTQLHQPVDEAIGSALFPAEIGKLATQEGTDKCSEKIFCSRRPSWSPPLRQPRSLRQLRSHGRR